VAERLLIFDCDGVLVDSERLANQVLAEAATEAGFALDAEEAATAYIGMTLDAALADVEARLGAALPDDFLPCYLERLHTTFTRELKPVPGIHEALDRLSDARCVASNGEPETTRHSLGITGLLHHFDPHVFNAAHVGRGKPDPALFLFAAEKLGAAPADCVVIEDSVPGVLAARAAKMRVFGYAPDARQDGQDAKRLAAAGAEIFDDMMALPSRLRQT
jgi:HAD superfamily hydrolase (TIGR01509 family)